MVERALNTDVVVVGAGMAGLAAAADLTSAGLACALFEAREYYRSAPWLLAAPGIAIVVAVAGVNVLGEALREKWDPR